MNAQMSWRLALGWCPVEDARSVRSRRARMEARLRLRREAVRRAAVRARADGIGGGVISLDDAPQAY